MNCLDAPTPNPVLAFLHSPPSLADLYSPTGGILGAYKLIVFPRTSQLDLRGPTSKGMKAEGQGGRVGRKWVLEGMEGWLRI